MSEETKRELLSMEDLDKHVTFTCKECGRELNPFKWFLVDHCGPGNEMELTLVGACGHCGQTRESTLYGYSADVD